MRRLLCLLLLPACYETDSDYVGDPIVEFTSAVYSAAEKQGSVTIGVVRRRSNDQDLRVTVFVESQGTAEGDGVDYEFAGVTLTWPSGQSGEKTVTIRLVDDGIAEGDETVRLKLGVPSAGSVGDIGRATLTIRDGDTGMGGAIQFSAPEYTVTAGETATIQLTRTGGASGPVSAVVHGTTLRWEDGDSSPRTVSIPTSQPGTIDLDIQLTEGSAILGTQSTAVLRVVQGGPTFVSSSSSVDESAGVVRIPITGTGSYATRDGTAGAEDYVPASGTVADAIEVTILDDDLREGNETFVVEMNGSVHTVTILDDEAPSGSVQFVSSSSTVSEGAGSVSVAVRKSGNASMSVAYSTRDGSAGLADYTATSGTLFWPEGDTGERTIVVPIADDALVEGAETFEVVLVGVSSATVTIEDNDASGGVFQFRLSEYRTSEASGSATITVQRVNGSAGAVSVTYVTNPGTASTVDYEPASGSLFWDDGDTSDRTFAVAIHDDSDVEPDETVALALQDPTGGASLGGRSSATLVIVNDDTAPVGEIQFEFADYTVDEGAGTATITVTRTNGSAGAASVRFEARAGTADRDKDFERAQGTLSWADGESGPKSFTVTILNDDKVEGDETVILRIRDDSGARLGALSEARLIIVDDD